MPRELLLGTCKDSDVLPSEEAGHGHVPQSTPWILLGPAIVREIMAPKPWNRAYYALLGPGRGSLTFRGRWENFKLSWLFTCSY